MSLILTDPDERFCNAFELVVMGTSGKKFYFFARSLEEKREWLRTLQPIIETLLDKQKEKYHREKEKLKVNNFPLYCSFRCSLSLSLSLSLDLFYSPLSSLLSVSLSSALALSYTLLQSVLHQKAHEAEEVLQKPSVSQRVAATRQYSTLRAPRYSNQQISTPLISTPTNSTTTAVATATAAALTSSTSLYTSATASPQPALSRRTSATAVEAPSKSSVIAPRNKQLYSQQDTTAATQPKLPHLRASSVPSLISTPQRSAVPSTTTTRTSATATATTTATPTTARSATATPLHSKAPISRSASSPSNNSPNKQRSSQDSTTTAAQQGTAVSSAKLPSSTALPLLTQQDREKYDLLFTHADKDKDDYINGQLRALHIHSDSLSFLSASQ